MTAMVPETVTSAKLAHAADVDRPPTVRPGALVCGTGDVRVPRVPEAG